MNKEMYKMSYLYSTSYDDKKGLQINNIKVSKSAYAKTIISKKISQELTRSTLNMVMNLTKDLTKQIK